MIVKFMTRMNQPDKASILRGTRPNSDGPVIIISELVPRRALTAKKLLTRLRKTTVVIVTIPLSLTFTNRIAKIVANNMKNKTLIKAGKINIIALNL